jgi:hypothetical protein
MSHEFYRVNSGSVIIINHHLASSTSHPQIRYGIWFGRGKINKGNKVIRICLPLLGIRINLEEEEFLSIFSIGSDAAKDLFQFQSQQDVFLGGFRVN